MASPALGGLKILESVQQNLDAKDRTITGLSQQLKDELTQRAAEVKALNDQIAGLNAFAEDAFRSALATATCFQGMQRWQADPTTSREQLGVWIDSGGHTAQSNPGTNPTPHGNFFWKPGDDQAPARFDFLPGGPFDNVFVYERFPMPATLPTFFVDKRTVSLSAADRAHINCLEWQQEITKDGKRYNMGWQMNFTSKVVRIFDYNQQTWRTAQVPFIDPGTDQFELMTEHRLDVDKTTHIAISVNGRRSEVNVSQPATSVAGAADKYTVSLFQLDSDSHGDAVGVNLHKAESRYL